MCVCVCMCVCININMYVCACIHACVCVCVCVCVFNNMPTQNYKLPESKVLDKRYLVILYQLCRIDYM